MFSKETMVSITEELINCDSPVGYYEEITPLMKEISARYGFELSEDRKRTLYLTMEGEHPEKTVCVGAHLDTIALIVRHICKDGTLEVRNLGGVNYYNTEGCHVRVHTRDERVYTGTICCKSHSTHVYEDARSRAREENAMMVVLDEKVFSDEDVRALGIEHGDVIAIEPDFRYLPAGYIKSRFIDDKAAVGVVFAVIEYMVKNNIKPYYNVKFAFPFYEEIGHGGSYLPPEIEEYVAIDIGLIGPDYTGDEFKTTICAKDNFTPYDRALTNKLIKLAKANDVNYAVDVFYRYGTDASAAIRAGNNVYAAAFGMCCFSSHGMERTHIDALDETAKLLYAYLRSE